MSTRGMSTATKSGLNVSRAVDWQFAATVGAKLVRPGPAVTDYTRSQVIDQLTEASRNAELPVREVTGLNEGGEIRSDSRHVLKPGEVYSLAVGGYDPQAGGALTSAMVAITPAGSELLHVSPASRLQ